MRKIKSAIKRVLSFKYLPIIVVFIAGALLGGLIVSQLASTKTSSRSSSRSSTDNKVVSERKAERLEEGYKKTKADIEEDAKAGKLTQEKADAVGKKLDEAYNFIKDKQGTSSEDRAAVRAKRAELRKWAEENDISTRYFIRIY